MTALVTPMRFDLSCHEGDTTPCIHSWNPFIPVSIFALGGLIGTLMTKMICRKTGLWSGLLFSSVLYSIGSFFVAIRWHVTLVSVGRLLTGIAAGACFVAIPFRRPMTFSGSELSMMPIVCASSTAGVVMGVFFDREKILYILWIPFFISICVLVGFGVIKLLEGFLRTDAIRHTKLSPNEPTAGEDESADIDSGAHRVQFEVEDDDDENDIQVQFAQVGLKDFFTELKYRKSLISVIALFTAQQFTGLTYFTQYLGELLLYRIQDNDSVAAICAFSLLGLLLLLMCPFISAVKPNGYYLFALGLSLLSSVLIVTGALNEGFGMVCTGAVLLQCASCLCVFSLPFIKVVDLAPKEASDAAHTLGMLTGWISMLISLLLFPILHSFVPATLYFFSMVTLLSIIVIGMLPIPEGGIKPQSASLLTETNNQLATQ